VRQKDECDDHGLSFSAPKSSSFPEEETDYAAGLEELLMHWGLHEQESFFEPSAPASFRPGVENLFFAKHSRSLPHSEPRLGHGLSAGGGDRKAKNSNKSPHRENAPLASTPRHVLAPLVRLTSL
jgi:hypothetical protein